MTSSTLLIANVNMKRARFASLLFSPVEVLEIEFQIIYTIAVVLVFIGSFSDSGPEYSARFGSRGLLGPEATLLLAHPAMMNV
jgi:hypothetical protein